MSSTTRNKTHLKNDSAGYHDDNKLCNTKNKINFFIILITFRVFKSMRLKNNKKNHCVFLINAFVSFPLTPWTPHRTLVDLLYRTLPCKQRGWWVTSCYSCSHGESGSMFCPSWHSPPFGPRLLILSYGVWKPSDEHWPETTVQEEKAGRGRERGPKLPKNL